jgi:hypothetical protein
LKKVSPQFTFDAHVGSGFGKPWLRICCYFMPEENLKVSASGLGDVPNCSAQDRVSPYYSQAQPTPAGSAHETNRRLPLEEAGFYSFWF